MHFKAIEAHLKQNGRLPVNIKIILEGEEEVGSANLDDFIRAHKDELKADVVVISDSAMFARGVPSICYGLRGLVYFQIDLRGSSTDLHSGSFGGAVANPAFVLAQMIAQMKDRGGRIKIPGFYDDVVAAAGRGAAGVGDAAVQREAVPEGLRHPEGVRRDRLHDARAHLGAADVRSERPAVRLHRRRREDGAAGRRDGQGQHAARAEPGSRQDRRAVRGTTCEKIAPKTVELKVTRMHGGKPWMTSFDNPFVQAAGRAIEKGFGQTPVFTREGGSIPVVSTFQEELGLPSVLFGVGLPDENAHAPNEKLDVGNFHSGIIASAYPVRRDLAHRRRPRNESCRRCRRLDVLVGALRAFYGRCRRRRADPFTLFVWEVLSAHSTPRKRDAALGALKRMRALTPDAMWRVAAEEARGERRARGPVSRAARSGRSRPAWTCSAARPICRR